MAKLVFIIALLSLIINDCAGGVDSLLKRTKRFVVYPMGGLFKVKTQPCDGTTKVIVFGLAIPVKLGLKQSMTMTANMQFQSREKRAAAPPTSDRSLAYRGVEALLDRPDYGDDEYDEDLDACYIDAQRAGRYGVDCFTLYTDCPYGHGILDRLTQLE